MKMFTAVVCVVSVAGVLAAATPAVAEPGIGDHRHFTLFQHDTSQEFVAIGNPNTGVGNLYIFGGDVLDQQGGTQVGRSAGQCAYSSATEILCSAAIGAGDGQIDIQGLADTLTFYAGQPTEFAVTGGTGRYRKARGTVTIRILTNAPTDAVVTVDLP